MRHFRRHLMIALVMGSLVAAVGRGQISPGPLSEAHADLDGSRQCAVCHDASKRAASEHCLSCHTTLRERIEAGLGLHAQPDFRACDHCHIEHHGREFELVWWGKEGIESFDHARTGYPLMGAHLERGCRDCHQAEKIVTDDMLAKAGKDLDRTFLGLESSCRACHIDVHSGQFSGQSCETCHEQSAWHPAPGFDHANASFHLTGRHAAIACTACHPRVRGKTGEPFLRYRGIRFGSCLNCHEDHHAGRLGDRCEACHTTRAWNHVGLDGFDHQKTRFPLVGKHREVSCSGCHGEALAVPQPRSDRCQSCHADAHLGQFASRGDKGTCTACHNEAGFEPPLFDVAHHQDTAYPLVGRHRQVECRACHRVVPTSVLASWFPVDLPSSLAGESAEVRQFRFRSSRCVSCHQNVHGAGSDSLQLGGRCTSCHDLSGWFSVAFDHAVTGYALEGEHHGLECVNCHRQQDSQVLPELPFSGLERSCASCHGDVHAGQFADRIGTTGCERCHASTYAWSLLDFDHSRDTRFVLDGAHARVPCNDCHSTEAGERGPVVRYRPLGTSCSSCHDPRLVATAGAPAPHSSSQAGEAGEAGKAGTRRRRK